MAALAFSRSRIFRRRVLQDVFIWIGRTPVIALTGAAGSVRRDGGICRMTFDPTITIGAVRIALSVGTCSVRRLAWTSGSICFAVHVDNPAARAQDKTIKNTRIRRTLRRHLAMGR